MISATQPPGRPGRSRTASDGFNRLVNIYSESGPDGKVQQPIITTSSSSSSSSSSLYGFYPANANATSNIPPIISSSTLASVVPQGNADRMGEASSTSQASSSRLLSAANTAHSSSSNSPSSSRQTNQPLSLTEVLSRSSNDKSRALDEVLAERNELCLEVNKLSTENIRIWNLVRRIKRENEELRNMSKNTLNSTASSSSHLNTASYAMTPSLSGQSQDMHQNQIVSLSNSTAQQDVSPSSRGGAFLTSSNPASSAVASFSSGSNANQPRVSLESTPSSGNHHQQISSASDTLVAPPSINDLAQSASRSTTHDPPPPLNMTNLRNEDNQQVSQASPSSSALTSHEALQSPQQTSIMRQRAAAQAQRLVSQNHHVMDLGERRGSVESHDFEAVESSSAADSDLGRRASEEEIESITKAKEGPLPAPPATQNASTFSQSKRPMMAPPTPERRGNSSLASSGQINKASSSSMPRLDTGMLSNVTVAVTGTNFRPSERAKDDISFYIDVEILGTRSSWRVEKHYSAFLALDARLKQKYSKSKSSMKNLSGSQLPDRSLFKDHAPGKVDQRKIMLEVYLQNLLAINLPDKDELCTFVTTDAIHIKQKDPDAITKEGFLTKKGANLGRWVTRLYILTGSTLEYYENRGGPQLGVINIIGAQIGRQQRSVTTDMDENSYRHAFLILESKSNASSEENKQMVRHVLCAESDEERDDWVDVLVRAIASLPGQMGGQNGNPMAPSQRSFSTSSSTGMTASPSTPTAKKTALPDGFRNNDTRSPQDSRHSPHKNNHTPSPVDGATFSAKGYNEPLPTSPRFTPDGKQRSLDEQYRTDLKSRIPPQPHLQQAMHPTSLRAKANTLDQGIPSSTSAMILSTESSQSQLPESSSVPIGLGNKDRGIAPSRPSISGPMNGTPIPTGYNFGAKEEPAATSNSGTQDTKKRFWHRFGGANSDKNQPVKQVFGVTLAESIAVSNVTEGLELPSVVYRCIEYLEAKDAASEEGIYRLSGSSAVIKNLRERFNAQGDVNMLASSEPYYDPHAVAGLLKQFLRELKDSVLTRDLHLDFLRVNDLTDRRERVNELGHLISLLPLANYSLLRTLCNHLIKVIEKSDVNKMTMRNVGIVFSPTLGIPGGIFALLLTEFDWVFFTDARGEPAPRQIEGEEINMQDGSGLGLRTGSPNPFGEDQHRMGIQSEIQEGESRRGHQDTSDEHIRSRDGRMMSNANTKRDNRNSLCYNEAEAERILGGPSGRYRLSSQREELEEAIANATIDMDPIERYDDGSADATYRAPLSPTTQPVMSMVQHSQASPRGNLHPSSTRQIEASLQTPHHHQIPQFQYTHNSSNSLGEPTMTRNTRSHSHNPRVGPLMPSDFHSSSNSDGHQ